MIDKVVTLHGGLQYYVLDEIIEDKKIYIYAIQVENKENIVTDKCIVCEVKFTNSGLVVDNISDSNEQERVNNMFISRMRDKTNS